VLLCTIDITLGQTITVGIIWILQNVKLFFLTSNWESFGTWSIWSVWSHYPRDNTNLIHTKKYFFYLKVLKFHALLSSKRFQLIVACAVPLTWKQRMTYSRKKATRVSSRTFKIMTKGFPFKTPPYLIGTL